MFCANQPDGLSRQELWQTARYQGMDDCIGNSRRNRDPALRDDVLAFPPTWYEFALESPQTVKVIESGKSLRRNLQSTRNDRMLGGNLI